MNCIQCREMLVDYIESVLGDQAGAVEQHLQQCPECQAELEQLRLLTKRLAASFQDNQAPSLDGRVMNQIITEQAAQTKRITEYTVLPGDYLWQIAEKIYGDGNQMNKLIDANNIPYPYNVEEGQKLIVP